MKILLIIGLIFAQNVSATPALSTTEIAPGIHVHFGNHELPNKTNHGAIANIGFIVGENCVAVIDTGGNPEQGYALKKAIEVSDYKGFEKRKKESGLEEKKNRK